MAGLTAVLVSPILESMERKKVPSALAITILCFGVLLFILLLGVIIFPLLVAEQIVRLEGVLKNMMQGISALAANPDSLKNYAIFKYLDRATVHVDVVLITDFLKNSFGTIADQVGKFVTIGSKSLFTWIFGFFGAFSNTILYLVFLIFILLERKELYTSFIAFLPKKVSVNLHKKVPTIQATLFSWWRGQAILCASIGLMTLVVLLFLDYVVGVHMEYHLSLALIAGMCEFIPII